VGMQSGEKVVEERGPGLNMCDVLTLKKDG
jgi:hypothetical protein